MMNTALSAKAEQIAQSVTFRNEKHKRFFLTYLPKCRYADVYHAALVYCLGIDEDTRKNVNSIYDFKTGCVKTECLHEGWITSGKSLKVYMDTYKPAYAIKLSAKNFAFEDNKKVVPLYATFCI